MTSTSDGLLLTQELAQRRRDLHRALSELGPRGAEKSRTERDYRIALKKRLAELKADGQPTTIVGDLARGDDEVADLKMKRDMAEVLYDSAKEAINVIKLDIRVLSEEIKRGWENADA